MRILVVTDAWLPQVNGVVRTLQRLAEELPRLGAEVVLEALASGLPVAAYPVTGPLDIFADGIGGVLSADLRAAALAALGCDRDAVRAKAIGHGWKNSAAQFLENVRLAMRETPIAAESPVTMPFASPAV